MTNGTFTKNHNQKNHSGIIKTFGTFALVGVAYFAWLWQFESLPFKSEAASNLPAMFGYLLLICIFVERSIEMFLSSSRGANADKFDREIEKLQNKIAGLIENKQTADEDGVSLKELNDQLEVVQDIRNDYRADSRFMAIWIGLFIGVMVALVGVRILGNIVETENLSGNFKRWFTLVDVLLTGSVLAGGSEAFNKIMKVYNSFMTKSAENNKA